MALFSFGKKKEEGAPGFDMGEPMAPQPQVPGYPDGMNGGQSTVDRILQLREQGMGNNQIVGTLHREGMSSSEIFDSMNQADMSGVMGNGNQVPMMDTGMMNGAGIGPQIDDAPQEFRPLGEMQEQAPMAPTPEPYPLRGGTMPPLRASQPQTSAEVVHDDSRQRIEELAEAIIDEKWAELLKNINRIIEWKNKIEARIAGVEQECTDLQKSFEELHKAVLGKIGEYDQNIGNVGTEIKAMEKVFQKVLPTMTDNIKELSRITRQSGGNIPTQPRN